jgi:transcriptional regulator with XRE-family HTH domain
LNIETLQSGSSREFKVALGKVLERQRKHLKLTAADVACVCGVRQSAISRYESGEATPGASVFLRLMIYLHLDIAELKHCLRFDYKIRRENALPGPSRSFHDLRFSRDDLAGTEEAVIPAD